MQLMSEDEWAKKCADDGEFALAARHWNGGLRLQIGDQRRELALDDGQVRPGSNGASQGIIQYKAPEDTWTRMLEAVPERFFNDLTANVAHGLGIEFKGDRVVQAQYYAAIMRAVELLRPQPQQYPLRQGDVGPADRFDAPVGRYVHLDLDGHDHRIYFEEAGQGIPLIMQHTAGCHSSQWRHLFEVGAITDRFRLIAYDLPYHGKSIPPVEKEWWAEPYHLKGAFLRSIPLKLARALDLERPVFMGCSVGGLMALDMAHKHAEDFRAVISVEGALNIPGSTDELTELYHPQVNNEYKARVMDGLMSPTSPKCYRKETSFVYACGWPPGFIGDLHYYVDEFDLRQKAGEIDTNKVGVHILSGEYDHSGTSELGQEAHRAIAGSTWVEMKGVGHFPMSENPDAFLEYLLPILEQIA